MFELHQISRDKEAWIERYSLTKTAFFGPFLPTPLLSAKLYRPLMHFGTEALRSP